MLNFQKPIDKNSIVWYNNNVLRKGTIKKMKVSRRR